MHSLKEASTEYVTALDETEKKLSSCPVEVGMPRCLLVTLVKSRRVVFDMCEYTDKEIGKQTYTHADHNTSDK